MKAVVLPVFAAMALMLSGCGLKKAVVRKFISPQAINGFINITAAKEESLNEYCDKKQNLVMANITKSIWWPGCGLISKISEFDEKGKGDGKCAPISDGGCVKKAIMKEMDDFNTEYGGKRVTYRSRAGKDKDGKEIEVMDLEGWFLAAPDATKDTPRIVVQHGFTSNSNKFRTMFVAYLLRKIGYSVLVNNLRDHCYSEDTKERIIGWGHAYPYDLLGAWDYLRKEADGAGAIDSSKVGILGFSMGGFTANNAFGLEPKIPGVWLDGAPFTPRDGFDIGFKKALGNKAFIHGAVSDDVWEHIVEEALKSKVDLSEHLPQDELPRGPKEKRKVFVTANKQDSTVPYSSGESLVKLLKTLPEQYDLIEFWSLDNKCDAEDHCIDFMTHTEDYEDKLTRFWAHVFEGEAYTSRLYEVNIGLTRYEASNSSVLIGAAFCALFIGFIVVRRERSRHGFSSNTELEGLCEFDE